jgi:hypothetical protein
MKDQLFLPTELSKVSNNLVIFDCTRLFGEVFGEFCHQKMIEIEGQDWLTQIRDQRKIYKINLSDTAFLLKECLTSDSIIRKVLPKSEKFYNKLDVLKKLRNENQHFNLKAGTEEIKAAVELYFNVCMDLNLGFGVDQYSILLRRLDELEAGKNFSIDPNLIKNLSEIERQKAEKEDQIIEKNKEILEREKEFNQIQKVISDRDSRIADLIKSNEEKTLAVIGLKNDNEKSKKEAQELRIEVSELKIQKETDKLTEKEFEEMVASLSEIISRINEDSSKRVIRKAQIGNPRPEIGSLWNKPKGKKKITLSVGKRDLVDSKTSKPLDYISEESRVQMAEEWLLVRPTGGRVFIDEEGDACTLIDEDLIYLGNINY